MVTFKNNLALEKVPDLKKKFYSMINKYQDMFTKTSVMWATQPETHLNTRCKACKQRVRHLAPPLRKNLRLQLEDWIRDSVIELSKSPWTSPLVPGGREPPEAMSLHYADTSLPDLLGRTSLSYAVMSKRNTSKCACII